MMDRKSLSLLVISAAVFAGAWFGIDYLYPPVPRPPMPPPSTNQVALRANAPATQAGPAGQASNTPPATIVTTVGEPANPARSNPLG